MAATLEDPQQVRQAVWRRLQGLDPSATNAVAEFISTPNVDKIVLEAVEKGESESSIFNRPNYLVLGEIHRDVQHAAMPKISIIETSKIFLDVMAHFVARSASLSSARQNATKPEQHQESEIQMKETEKQRREALANRLGVPSIADALRTAKEHRKIASDPKNQKPEVFNDYDGGWSLEIPRPWR